MNAHATPAERERIVEPSMVSTMALRRQAEERDALILSRSVDTIDRLVDKVAASERDAAGWRSVSLALFALLVESYTTCDVEYNATLRAQNDAVVVPVNPIPGAGTEDESDIAYLWRIVFWQTLAHRMNERALLSRNARAEQYKVWLGHFDVALHALLAQINTNVHPMLAEEARRVGQQFDVIMANMRKPVEDSLYLRCSVTPCSSIVIVILHSVASTHDPDSLRAACSAALVDPDRPLCDRHRSAEHG